MSLCSTAATEAKKRENKKNYTTKKQYITIMCISKFLPSRRRLRRKKEIYIRNNPNNTKTLFIF